MSRFRSVIVAIIIAALSVAGGVLLLTCSDRGTNPAPPPPPPEPPKDYPVYFFKPLSGQSGLLFRFTVVSHHLDSVSVPISLYSEGLRVSADGMLLYLYDGQRYRIFDATTLQEIDTLHQQGQMSVSPDGKYLSLADSVHLLLDADDYSILAIDSIRTISTSFSPDGRYLFILWHNGTDYLVKKADLSNLTIVSEFNVGPAGIWLQELEASKDGAAVSVYRLYAGESCGIELYDGASGIRIGWSLVVPGLGSMCLNPDANTLYFTGPGNYFFFDYGTFSLAKWRLGQEITGTRFVDTLMYWPPCNDNGHALLNGVTATPDGRWLVGLDYYGTHLTVVDMLTDSLVYCRLIRVPLQLSPRGPSCQQLP